MLVPVFTTARIKAHSVPNGTGELGISVMIRLRKKLQSYKRGQALVELTLILPMLLTLTLGAVELSNMIYTYQVMHHLTAQGASMASRLTPGITLDDVINKVIAASCPLISAGPPPESCPASNATKWRVIFTEMGPDTSVAGPNPPYVVLNQIVRGAAEVSSSKRICASCSLVDFTCDPTSGCVTPNNVPNIDKIGSGQSLFAFEVFYDYSPITVLGDLEKILGSAVSTFAGKFYERSIF